MEEEPKPLELPVKEEEPPEKTVDVAAEKKVVKITSEIPQTERMQKRAERFNVPVSLESKKAARAARFGISPVPSKGLSSDTKPMVNLDKLKERAQRFGLNVSSISRKAHLRNTVNSVPDHPSTVNIAITRQVQHKGENERFSSGRNQSKTEEGLLAAHCAQRTGLVRLNTESCTAALLLTRGGFLQGTKTAPLLGLRVKSEDDEKLKKRKERFGIVTSSVGTGTTEDTEAKKRKRAERFGIA
ncbi:SAP domain-containing ribonucleoprotein isoform 4-T6 [Dama dama]|uniref:SAP domain-containing ribonucleoprotein isoform X4 n=1 Tax=Dama dama TaxID=30532 RepID=UPI002A3705CA|nr:SAP domain-containing ribonucleoprotein isoform X4 [Dama dama]XP_060988727.1 SAP domain-containing ribonucleoprotein isoform X4 [Dama dama]